MKNVCREEPGRQDDVEAGGTMISRDCSSSCRNFELARCTSEGLLIRKIDLDRSLESDSRQLTVVAKFAGRISFGGGRFLSLNSRIPRNVVSLDEQYLRQCLEWVCGKASKVMPSDGSLALTASTMDGNTELWKKLAVKCASKPQSVNSNVCHGISATDMKSIDWIDHHNLQSPTLYSTDMRFENSASPAGVSTSLSSGRSSNSATTSSVSQGMLVCSWMDGLPRFIFSPDETRKVYVAHLTSVTSSDRIKPDYKYSIHINEQRMKERAIDRNCHYLVGEINVIESICICSDVSEVRMTEFVLFGGYKIPAEERGDQVTKNKGLPSKAVKAFSFKSRRSSKRRNTPCRNGISEEFSTESSQDKVTVLQSYNHPCNELAAIVVKDRVKGTIAEQKPEPGGWGLNFLRKIQAANNINTQSEECSGSMNVIIPAGLHGGRMSEFGGPSSLIERWKSGGKCDCGGWDLGCPLTLLEAPSNEPAGNLKTVDLVIRGSITKLRMMNVRDGLFLVRFDRTLSALQTMSIAVAYIHSQCPLLQQRLV